MFLLVFGDPDGAKVSFEGFLGAPEEPWGAPRVLRECSWELRGSSERALGCTEGTSRVFLLGFGPPKGGLEAKSMVLPR